MNVVDRAFIRAYELDERSPGEEPVAAAARPAVRSGAVSSPSPAASHPASMTPSAPAPSITRPPSETAIRPPVERSGPAAQRRPLSAFAAKQTVDAVFHPALEVDGYRWSPACDDLVSRRRELLRPALHTLLAADEAGRSLIGIGGQAAGVGCTTVLVCLARLLADAGKSVAIVDGNFRSPGLATQIGLAVESGWENVLTGALPLAEAVVWSIADRIALLPLVNGGPAAAASLQSIHASVTAGVLRYHYDMVLFDLGQVGDPQHGSTARRLAQQCRLDGAVLVSGAAATASVHPQRLMQTAPELASICLGVVENQLRAA